MNEDMTINNFDIMTNYPFFSPDEMIDLGVQPTNRYYKIEPDTLYLDVNNKIPVIQWFNDYKLSYYGALSENYDKLCKLRLNKLLELYNDYDKIKSESTDIQIKARKQSILELGWNPELTFDKSIRCRVDYNRQTIANNNLLECVDLTNDNIVLESKTYSNKYPLFVILTYTHTLLGKVITTVTNSIYSHASFALDSNLRKTYSFNANVNGFSLESIDRYKTDKDGIMAVYAIMVDKFSIKKIQKSLDEYILNKRTTTYGFFTALGAFLNKPINIPKSMICSQFVDSLLKMINIDVTTKDSTLVIPNDFYISKDSRMFKVFEGKINDYDYKKVNSLLGKINTIDSSIVNEAKEFPIGFDKDGNLLIRNIKKLDYREEFEKSHKLLKIYEKEANVNPIAYELCKLWFLNSEIEKKIYHSNLDKPEKDELYKLRSQILNDFNKYLKFVQDPEKGFNFTTYYNNTPFSDASIKIDKYTIEYGSKLLKTLLL